MIKKIVVIIGICASIPSSTMDIGQFYRQIQERIAKEEAARETQIPADKVLLISNDEQEFLVPLEIANQSKTIKHLLEDQEKKVIPFANISGSLLKEIVDLLTVLDANKNLKGKKLLDTLEQKVKIADAFELLQAANYLDIPSLMNLAARKIAMQEAAKPPKKLFEKKELTLAKKLAGASAKDMLKLVAHYHFLMSAIKLKEVPETSYAFSIQDFLDYRPAIFKIKDKKLNLDNLHINNLDEIDSIPDIQTVTSLYLNNNQITKLPAALFNLSNLQLLGLAVNQITEIPEEISNLKNLDTLFLSYNAITHLPDNFFDLNKLQLLHLDHNQIIKISHKITQLQNLIFLNLSYNLIDQIDPNMFTHMYAPIGSLKYLRLNNNRLTEKNINDLYTNWHVYPYRFSSTLSL